MINPNSFCIGPWAEVRVNPDGSMNFCHAADNGMIPKHENIQDWSVDQYFQDAPSVVQARGDLLQGEHLARCHRCYRDEQQGLMSWRQRRNIQAAIFPGKDFLPSADEALPRILSWNKPRFYHVSLSNLCNMACMMCAPGWSSQLATIQIKAGVADPGTPVLRDWTRNDHTWEAFVQHLLQNDQIVCLHFMGGEPFYHRRFTELLDRLVDANHCDFDITLVTNGSIYDPETVGRLERFRSVAIEISVEAFDLCNDYIRYPSQFQKIRTSIQGFLSHRSDRLAVVLRSVPQALSALQYHTLLGFAREHQVIIDSNVLHSPDFLAINVLPDHMRSQAIDSIRPYVGHGYNSARDINVRDATDFDRSLSVHAQRVIDQISTPCEERWHKQHQLVGYCSRMDTARKIHLADYVPALAEFFDQRGYRASHADSTGA